uniref:Cytochrome P450 monooxygenase n=1 Tax=Nocardiopsis sp. CMB-M0232 TaxID=1231934 RepID=A0A0D5BUK9_9ACTN|nr:cytochrome P450 monooxygenase [Nocardiopsis sp. CMB-M0232]
MTPDDTAGGCPHPHQPYDPTGAHRADPHSFYRWARDEAPVSFSAEIGAFLVADHALVSEVLNTPEVFSSAQAFAPLDANPPEIMRILDHLPLPPHMVQADPPQHEHLRALGERVLHGRRISAAIPALRRLADDLIDGFAPHGHADLLSQYAHPFVQTALGELTGFHSDDADRLDAWNTAFLTLAAPVGDLAARTEAAHALRDYDAHIIDALEHRRREPREDILTELVRMVDDDGVAMNLPDAVMFVRGLYAGGIHTTRDTVVTTVLTALSHGLWEQAASDPRAVAGLVEETLRFESPHRGMMRVVARPAVLGGVELDAGSRVLLLFGSANRDQNAFTQADTFAPGRADGRGHLAFGAGIHRCLGRALARLEIRIAVETLASRLPGLRLPAGFEADWTPEWFFRALRRLDVHWDT